MPQLTWLAPGSPFPDPQSAFDEPNGLLAAGGDLSPRTLLKAYHQGIFPWYSDNQPILWWSPNPRCVIYPKDVHLSKSMKKHLRKMQPVITFDQAFADVIRHCARLDSDQGTWITDEMEAAYIHLHQLGHAHSLEVWREQQLVGGLYGLAIGKAFFGESMFSLETNASKVGFYALCRQLASWGYTLIDCQVENPHLLSLGASTIKRSLFLKQLDQAITSSPTGHKWQYELQSECLGYNTSSQLSARSE